MRTIYLDKNESPFALFDQINRYPDPLQAQLKQRLAQLHGVETSQIFLGNGGDEVIDLALLACCEPYEDEILVSPPTFGVYEDRAAIHRIKVKRIPLLVDSLAIDISAIRSVQAENSKIIFICTPNNPTGSVVELSTIEAIAATFPGVVFVDEAYIDFADCPSALTLLKQYRNIAVLRSFSKSIGAAAIRLGVLYAEQAIISEMTRKKLMFNVSGPTISIAMKLLDCQKDLEINIANTKALRDRLLDQLKQTRGVEVPFGKSYGNFILARFDDADRVLSALRQRGIIVRDRSTDLYCENCLRITVGSSDENDSLLECLREIL